MPHGPREVTRKKGANGPVVSDGSYDFISTAVHYLPEPSGSATQDTEAIQNAFNLANGTNGVHIVAAPGVYQINSSMTHYGQTWLEGVGWSDNQDVGDGSYEGTTFKWSGGALGARRAMFESAGFVNDNPEAQRGCRFSGFMVSGAGATTGNGFTLWVARMHMEHVFSRGWAGTTAGHGRDVLLATNSVSGGTGVTLGGGENCEIFHCRFGSARERIYIESGNQQYTDGMIDDIEFTIATGSGNGGSAGNEIADLYMLQAGAWRLNKLHFNGAFGHCVYAANCSGLTIMNSFLDGWGCSPVDGVTYAAIALDTLSGFNGGAGIIEIIGNNWRARGDQNTGAAPTSKWPVFWVKPGSAGGFDAVVDISHNSGFRRNDTVDATQGSGTTNANQKGNFVFLLEQTTTNPGQVTYTLCGNTPEWTPTGTPLASGSLPYSDASMFAVPSSATSPRSVVNETGNSWNFGNSVPSTGFWFKNSTRRRDVTASTSMGWGNTTTGFSGTWKTMPAYGA